jgi:putative MATE family efflux protein
MIAMMATALVAIMETAYVGRLGAAPLAGLALVFPMVMLMQMMSAGAMGGGVSSAIARALGGGHEERAASLALHAIAIGLTLGLVFTVLFLLAGPTIYSLLGGRDAPLVQALLYSNIVFVGASAIWLTNTLASVVRGTGNMRVPSIALLLAAALQIIGGGALGLGIGPVPRLGMPGVALGQVFAFGVSTAILLWYLLSSRSRISLSKAPRRLHWEMFADILKVGALASLSPLQTVLAILILTRLVSHFGTEALAGYGIGARLEFLLVPITFAIGVACVPMVGMAMGAGMVTRARRVAWTGAALAASILGALGMAVALYPDIWAARFTSDAQILESTRSYLRWAGPCYGLFGAGLCLYFASQGAGKVLGPVLAGTLRLVIIAGAGWWLAITDAPVWQLYALIAAGMVTFGLSTIIAVKLTRWGPDRFS